MSQQQAVGVIQTLGFPAVLAAADATLKNGRVTLVYFDKGESGTFVIAIRGPVAEVKPAMKAGFEAADNTFGGKVATHYIVPNPPDNVVAVLPIDYSEKVEPYRV
ncbi:carbon dioxide-concentrating mechanism protein CcmK [Myxosarcina sp. GI1]|uniref:carbon dioxide-concentrating mechanism protein CcmK n=1 Tax=Myxosarcina sp. GI1 TaxID=1541065 RepID=UPI00055E28D3|nr:carbon dioxide-concentrating mechanism protein CcmK [Myxosarcina sp. GI1]